MAARKRASGLVKPSKGGRITIPAEYRARLGIGDDTLLHLSVDGDELRVRPVRARTAGAGSPWLKELYDLFAPVREEAKAYTEEEINAAIDEAVKAVRQSRA